MRCCYCLTQFYVHVKCYCYIVLSNNDWIYLSTERGRREEKRGAAEGGKEEEKEERRRREKSYLFGITVLIAALCDPSAVLSSPSSPV